MMIAETERAIFNTAHDTVYYYSTGNTYKSQHNDTTPCIGHP